AELADVPRGTLRLHTSTVAETRFVGSTLTEFLTAHPEVRLDLVASEVPVDIVAEGYDAGIQLGEVIDRDMIAIPVTGDLRLAVVGAPSYFERRGVPTHPRDLADHDCLNWHPTAGSPPYRWEFTEDGRDFTQAVPARVLSTDAALNRRFAMAGLGVTLAFEVHVRDAIARGDLVAVREEFCAPFPEYYLYYPERRHASPALRALIRHLPQWRESGAPRPPARP
ncbi:MAG: LysR substrate-binding domain-containing protein, partial [Gemmatimonadota bacterium]